MKKLVLASAIAAATMGVSAPVMADGHASGITTSANVGLYTDYRFRGVSQTDEGPAIQGGFDVDFGNGFYVGNWNSNLGAVSYPGTDGIEMDFYGGYAGEVDGLSYDVGVLQ
ncbi:MAG: TorF family putative porin, partial [Limnobacter sp.]|nr:TorF family putative porin [Limnobacter sp.]